MNGYLLWTQLGTRLVSTPTAFVVLTMHCRKPAHPQMKTQSQAVMQGAGQRHRKGGGFLKNPGSSFCVLPKHKAAACITIAGTELTQLCGEWLGHGHAHVGRRWPMSDRVVRPQAHRV